MEAVCINVHLYMSVHAIQTLLSFIWEINLALFLLCTASIYCEITENRGLQTKHIEILFN